MYANIGKIKPVLKEGYKYFSIIVNDATRFKKIEFIKIKA